MTKKRAGTAADGCIVALEPGDVARYVPARVEAGGGEIELDGGWEISAWIEGLASRRRPVRWKAGRLSGVGCIDVMPAGRGRTWMALTLDVEVREWRRNAPVRVADLLDAVRANIYAEASPEERESATLAAWGA